MLHPLSERNFEFDNFVLAFLSRLFRHPFNLFFSTLLGLLNSFPERGRSQRNNLLGRFDFDSPAFSLRALNKALKLIPHNLHLDDMTRGVLT